MNDYKILFLEKFLGLLGLRPANMHFSKENYIQGQLIELEGGCDNENDEDYFTWQQFYSVDDLKNLCDVLDIIKNNKLIKSDCLTVSPEILCEFLLENMRLDRKKAEILIGKLLDVVIYFLDDGIASAPIYIHF